MSMMTRARIHSLTHTHTHTHTQVHTLPMIGQWKIEESNDKSVSRREEESFSFDLKEESEEECPT